MNRQSAPYEFFCPPGQGKHPLICITPLLGQLVFFEDLFFERLFARFFHRHGFAVALMGRSIFAYAPGQSITQIRNYMETSIERNRTALDRILQEYPVDENRLASFGISFGAVINLNWAARDPRVRTHVFALAGGPLPEICISSRDPLLSGIVRDIKNYNRLEDSKLLEVLREQLKDYDPLHAASLLHGQDILLALALFDRVIRFQYGKNLRQALKHPAMVYLPLGHYLSVLAVPFLKRRALSFFHAHLGKAVQ